MCSEICRFVVMSRPEENVTSRHRQWWFVNIQTPGHYRYLILEIDRYFFGSVFPQIRKTTFRHYMYADHPSAWTRKFRRPDIRRSTTRPMSRAGVPRRLLVLLGIIRRTILNNYIFTSSCCFCLFWPLYRLPPSFSQAVNVCLRSDLLVLVASWKYTKFSSIHHVNLRIAKLWARSNQYYLLAAFLSCNPKVLDWKRRWLKI